MKLELRATVRSIGEVLINNQINNMKKVLFFSLALAAFAGCQVNELAPEYSESALPEAKMTNIYVGMESDVETRTSTNESMHTLWSKGDMLNFFCGINNTKKDKYILDDECAGDKFGVFYGPIYAGAEDMTQMHQPVLVYPFSESVTCEQTEAGFAIAGVTIPAQQNFVAGTYANGAHPMVSVGKDNESINFNIKNTNTAFAITLTGSKKIDRIVVSSENEYLAGPATITAAYGVNPEIKVIPETGSKTVELLCNGVQLSETPTVFYLTFAPCQGPLSLKIYDTEGGYLYGTMNADENGFARNEHFRKSAVYAPNGSIQKELKAAFDKGGEYTLPMNVNCPTALILRSAKSLKLDLNGYTLTMTSMNNPQITSISSELKISNGKLVNTTSQYLLGTQSYKSNENILELTNVEVVCDNYHNTSMFMAIDNGTNVVLNNVSVVTDGNMFAYRSGEINPSLAGITINGGKFMAKSPKNPVIFSNIDGNIPVTFNGGLFSDKSYKKGVKWVETGDEAYPWTPVALSTVMMNGVGYNTIQEAINEATTGGEVIAVAEGTYTEILDIKGGKNFTIQPQEGANVTIAGVAHESNGSATTAIFNNITFDNSLQTEGWFTGTAPNIKPCVGAWGGNLAFNDCTFNVAGTKTAETGVMTWWTGDNKMSLTFTGCTFNGIDNHNEARAMQIFGKVDLTVDKCIFNTYKRYSLKYVGAEGTKAVLTNNTVNNAEYMVEIGASAYPGNAYEVTISGSVLGEGIEDFKVANVEEQIVNRVEYSNKAASVNGEKYDTISEAFAAAQEGQTVTVKAGEYTFPASSLKAGVTVECEEGTVFTGSSKLNIEGATVINAEFSNPTGSAVTGTINGIFKDCVFEGSNALRSCYAGDNVVFENCVFSGSTYGVHFDDGANDATFKKCTFSGFNAFGAALTQLTLENCVFVSNGKSGYNGANLWGSTTIKNTTFTFDGTASNEWIDCIGSDKTYVIENCVVEGPVNGIFNKDYIFSRNDETDITINGVLYEDYMVNTISTAEELKEFAKAVNDGENNFSKKTVFLTTDIDLNNDEWTPIGNSTYTFQGTFNGNNKTISNLVITGNNSNVGLFGFTTNGEIKNLTVHNAKVSGYLDVAVVAGTPYTSKYTNINVTGHVEVNGFAYVGAVGGKNAYANWENVTVNVDETSFIKANSIDGDKAYRTYVGGVCGFNGEGGHSFTNITSNIDVIGSTCDVGGLFGIAHYGNKFVNCSCSGDVEITTASEAADAEEIGGIAGVWNNGGADVIFDGCSFTGALKTNITEGVDLSNNIIVGKSYSATGTGNLIIK